MYRQILAQLSLLYPMVLLLMNLTSYFTQVLKLQFNSISLGNVILEVFSVLIPSIDLLTDIKCQSADIMSSLCRVGIRVRVRVRVNNFSSKTTRPRDVLFFLKDTLSIEDEKLFKACKSVCSSVC